MVGGTTAHSLFRIPLVLNADSTCSVSNQSDAADLLRRARVFFWDEAPMAHRHCFEAVDRLLRDVVAIEDDHASSKPFGAKVFVFGGDWRQVLPVVPQGSRASIVNATLKRSSLWLSITPRFLTINKRLRSANGDEQAFSDWLRDLGEGKLQSPIQIPAHMLAPTSDPNDLLMTVFGDLRNVTDSRLLISNCILTPLNESVDLLNDRAMQIFQLHRDLPEFCYNSADSFPKDDANLSAVYPVEFLNSLQPSGMPPHVLKLKVGVPIILLRTINPALGLMNGTRLIVTRLGRRVIQARIATGNAANIGREVVIPRIDLTPTDSRLPFVFTRRQFPIRLAFALTINKSQGQTLSKIGLYLPQPCFSHGQLYVALSRVSDTAAITVMLGNSSGATPNIVYEEIFR